MSNFLSAARWTDRNPLPHQQAAWNWAWDQLSAAKRAEFLELFRADPAPAISSPSLEPALELIKEFEGFRESAYPDPDTGADPWTCGYGFTRWPDGSAVRPGDSITQENADSLLLNLIEKDVVPALAKTIPGWKSLSALRQCALISFSWNVGWHWYGSSGFQTLSNRLRKRDYDAVPGALLLYVNPGGPSEPGLLRRRKAEGELWGLRSNVHLLVDYEWQHDNSPRGWRTCLSSSCAMLARYWGKVGGDKEYISLREHYGDTTDIHAHIKTLRSLGLNPRFISNSSPERIAAELKSGRPCAVGWLHKGDSHKPTGFGHWSVICGLVGTDYYICHDPYGKADLLNGGFLDHTSGENVHYDFVAFNRRWMPDGPNTGWMITVSLR